jgi:hypothetical protein
MSDLDASERGGAGPEGAAAPARCPYPGPSDTAAASEPAVSDPACPFPEAEAGGRPSACGYAGQSKRGYFVPGIIALAVLLAVGAFAYGGGLSHASPSAVDGSRVATLIAETYQNNHRLASPPPVQCPARQPAATGHRFGCQLLRQAGAPLPVEVTETGGGQFTFQVAGGP